MLSWRTHVPTILVSGLKSCGKLVVAVVFLFVFCRVLGSHQFHILNWGPDDLQPDGLQRFPQLKGEWSLLLVGSELGVGSQAHCWCLNLGYWGCRHCLEGAILRGTQADASLPVNVGSLKEIMRGGPTQFLPIEKDLQCSNEIDDTHILLN